MLGTDRVSLVDGTRRSSGSSPNWRGCAKSTRPNWPRMRVSEAQIYHTARSVLPRHTIWFSIHSKVLLLFHFGHGFTLCGKTHQLRKATARSGAVNGANQADFSPEGFLRLTGFAEIFKELQRQDTTTLPANAKRWFLPER
jgi:hypothetical protein